MTTAKLVEENSEEGEMQMQLGAISGCFHHLREQEGEEAVLKAMARAGLGVVQLVGSDIAFGSATEDDIKQMQDLLAKYELSVGAYHHYLGEEGEIWKADFRGTLERALDFCQRLGVEVLVGALPGGPDTLPQVSEICARRGIHQAIENHHGNPWAESPQQVWEACRDLDHVGSCLDTGHFAVDGYDCPGAVDLLGEKIYDVHLGDTTKLGDLTASCVLGEGLANVGEVLRRLKAIGYDRMLAMEFHFPESMIEDPKFDAVSMVARSREFCEKILSEKQG